MIRRILYAFLPACLLAAGIAGCDDETVEALPETVPLIVEVSGKSFVMGEELTLTMKVNDDKNPERVSDEDFDVRLTAMDGDKDVSQKAFKSFPSMVTFPKGEKILEIKLSVTKDGLQPKEKLTVNINAFVRGYAITDPTQTVVIADHHYTVISLKNNTDNVINEGDEFTLQADVPVPVVDDTDVYIEIPDNQKAFYETLPPTTLTIPAGSKHGEVTAKTLKNPEKTRDETLTLSFTTVSAVNPLDNETLEVTMKDLNVDKGDRLVDERWVYDNPKMMFVSSEDVQASVLEWNSSAETQLMQVGDPHPTKALADEGWKFYTATEFHQIDNCYSSSSFGRRTPKGFADQTTAATQGVAAVINAKYADVTDAGALRMWAMKIPEVTLQQPAGQNRDYGCPAFYSAKGKWGPGFMRILPGVRIESRIRTVGNKKGFNMAIWLMGTTDGSNPWPACGEIDILENPAGTNDSNVAHQTVHAGVTGNDITQTTNRNIAKMKDWNVYWVEWVNDSQLKFGINGETTKTINKGDLGEYWPFDTTANPNGLYLILTMGIKSAWALPNPGDDWDSGFSALNNYERDYANKDLPAMEIDWIRYYTNKASKDEYEKQAGDYGQINRNFTLW